MWYHREVRGPEHDQDPGEHVYSSRPSRQNLHYPTFMTPSARYSTVLAAFTKTHSRTEVARLTGISVRVVHRLWEEGESDFGLAPIKDVIQAAGSSVADAASQIRTEVVRNALVHTGEVESANALANAREVVENSTALKFAQIRESFAEALKQEQDLISTGRNAVTGVFVLSTRTLGALQAALEKTLDRLATTAIESPQEALTLIERVTEILHKAGLAAKNIADMERQLQLAAGWTPPNAEKPTDPGGQKPVTPGSVAESIRTLQRAADIVRPFAERNGDAVDVPYQEEAG